MDFRKIPKLNPKRINRCYCYSNCWCDINSYNKPVPNSTTKTTTAAPSSNKFIKIRNENGQLRPKFDRIPYSGLQSLSSSSCSYHNDHKTNSNQSRRSSSSTTTLISSSPTNKEEFVKIQSKDLFENAGVFNGNDMTEPRQWYELSKDQMWKAQDCPTRNFYLSNFFRNPAMFLSTLDDHHVTDLNNFRLNNPEDCFNILSKYSINKRLGMYDSAPAEHICEFTFKLNQRGLLEPTITSQSQLNSEQIRCQICGKVADVADSNGFVPIRNNHQKIHKIVVEVNNNTANNNKNTTFQTKSGMRRKKMDEPGNSLALIYQKKY